MAGDQNAILKYLISYIYFLLPTTDYRCWRLSQQSLGERQEYTLERSPGSLSHSGQFGVYNVPHINGFGLWEGSGGCGEHFSVLVSSTGVGMCVCVCSVNACVDVRLPESLTFINTRDIK